MRRSGTFANDGMTWQFDAGAPQVDQFKEGEIIFATGLAVGRILNLRREGKLVTVVLGPIQLTDVIKNGKFAMNQPIDVANVLAYPAPNFSPAEGADLRTRPGGGTDPRITPRERIRPNCR